MLKSKFRFHGEYIAAIFLASFASFLTFSYYSPPPPNAEGILLIVIIVLWGTFIYSLISILKIPRIVISKDGIHLKAINSSRQILWSDIKSIDITGKKRVASTMSGEEVSKINLIDNSVIYFRSECYKNSPQIRQLLYKAGLMISENRQVNISNEILFLENKIEKKNVFYDDLNLLKYSGIPFLNFNALIIYGFSIAMILLAFEKNAHNPYVGLILMLPIITFYLALGFQLHYYFLSDKFFVVKNSFLFWIKHVYEVDNIFEVVFETPYKMSNSIRIITKDFKVKLYPGGGLRMKHWRALKKHFSSLGISVRDEIGI